MEVDCDYVKLAEGTRARLPFSLKPANASSKTRCPLETRIHRGQYIVVNIQSYNNMFEAILDAVCAHVQLINIAYAQNPGPTAECWVRIRGASSSISNVPSHLSSKDASIATKFQRIAEYVVSLAQCPFRAKSQTRERRRVWPLKGHRSCPG